jgi:CheY-like chemotaxis protein
MPDRNREAGQTLEAQRRALAEAVVSGSTSASRRWGRSTGGKMQLRQEWVDLGQAVGRAADAARPLVEARRRELTVSLPASPVRLLADPTRLEQVVTNLLNNAARYTPEGGRIWLTAEVAGGEVPESAPAPPVESSAAERVVRVLLVDDNVDAAESLAMLLRLWGHEVAVAHDGPAGLRAAETQLPQVALLDISLPGMDGYELARRLRAQPGLGQTVLVALTGWAQEGDRRRSQEAGFDHHLVKPVELSALQELPAQAGPREPA